MLVFRIGAVFGHLVMAPTTCHDIDNSMIVVLESFWPLLEKFFQSEHIENASLSVAACRALSQAIKSAGNSPANFKYNLGELKILFPTRVC